MSKRAITMHDIIITIWTKAKWSCGLCRLFSREYCIGNFYTHWIQIRWITVSLWQICEFMHFFDYYYPMRLSMCHFRVTRQFKYVEMKCKTEKRRQIIACYNHEIKKVRMSETRVWRFSGRKCAGDQSSPWTVAGLRGA